MRSSLIGSFVSSRHLQLCLVEILEPVRWVEISRRAGLNPPIEITGPLLTSKSDELLDIAAWEAILNQLAGQDPPYDLPRFQVPPMGIGPS